MDFALSKIGWFFFDPAHLALTALAVAVWLMGGDGKARRAARRLTAGALLFFVAVAVTPLSDAVTTPLENRFPPPATLPDDIGGIIVLGGATSPPLTRARGQPSLNAAAERLTAFAELSRRYPTAALISSGGSGLLFNQNDLEDAPTKGALAQMGAPADRVIYENRSRNTWENGLFSRDLTTAAAGGSARPWILVTSAMHMPRAVGVFRRLNIPVVPYPVDYRTRGGGEPWLRAELADNLAIMSYGAREWAGLIAYRAAGRLDELFPGPQ